MKNEKLVTVVEMDLQLVQQLGKVASVLVMYSSSEVQHEARSLEPFILLIHQRNQSISYRRPSAHRRRFKISGNSQRGKPLDNPSREQYSTTLGVAIVDVHSF